MSAGHDNEVPNPKVRDFLLRYPIEWPAMLHELRLREMRAGISLSVAEEERLIALAIVESERPELFI